MLLRSAVCYSKFKNSLFILCFVPSVFLGCTYIPSTKARKIERSDDLLYSSTAKSKVHDGDFIRAFDINKNKWARAITFPSLEKPWIQRMFIENGSIIAQINQGRHGKNRGIYSIDKSGDINKIGDLTSSQVLSALDKDFFYAVESQAVNNVKEKRTKFVFVGIKYSRKTKCRIEYHFEQNPNLVVRDVWDDDKNYWYACFQEDSPRNYVVPEGRLVLVSKSKLTDKVEEFYNEKELLKFDAEILGDKNWLWIFRHPRDSGSFIRFSKEEKTYESIKLNIRPFLPFADQSFDKENSHFWALSTSSSRSDWQIYCIDKKSLKVSSSPIDIPNEIRPTGAIYADKDYLWVDVYKYMKIYAPSGNQIPYLLRISKSDFSCQLISVKPTFGEAITTVYYNFMSWLLAPFFRG